MLISSCRHGAASVLRTLLVLLLLAGVDTVRAADTANCPPAPVQPTPEMAQAGMRDARDHGFLWRISKNGHTSYLYGTIHIARFGWMFPGPDVMHALRATDTIALELDMLDPDVQGRMFDGMKVMHGTALPPSMVQRMRRQAEAMCIPYDRIAGMSPELQITTLTVLVGRREGLDAAYAIDAVLAGIGHGAGMNVVSLETPESQLQALQMPNAQDTAAFVEDGLADMESGHALIVLRRIAKVWADSDYDELAHYGEWCDCLKSAIEREEMKRLLDERNPNLASRIDALHADGKRVFAAVGSLHMFGQTGLPTLMRKRGYRVERVDFESD